MGPKHYMNMRNSVDNSGNRDKEKSEFNRLYTFGKHGESKPKSSERASIIIPAEPTSEMVIKEEEFQL